MDKVPIENLFGMSNLVQLYLTVGRVAEAEAVACYDAAYLELAVRQGIPLATLVELPGAAAITLRVPLLPEKLD